MFVFRARPTLRFPRLFVLFFMALSPSVAPAQLPIAPIVLKGAVGDLLKSFEDMADRLLQEGESTGNALIASVGNELAVATENLRLALHEEQNTAYENLGKVGQDYFTQLNLIIRAATGPLDRAIKIIEVANLNLIELTNRLPFTHKQYIYINKVAGLTQLYRRGGPYQLTASGLGFGQDPDRQKYRLSIMIDGKPLPEADLNRTPPYDLGVEMSSQVLEPYFSDKDKKFVRLSIKADAEVKRRCWLIFSCKRHVVGEWPLRLVLLPRFPGQLTGDETVKGEPVLDGKIKETSVDVPTRGCKPDHPCDWRRELKVANNQRFTRVWVTCVGPSCRWCYAQRQPGGAPDYDSLDGGTRIRVYRHCDGEADALTTYHAEYQTLNDSYEPKPLDPISLQFGEVERVKLSQQNTSCTYHLTAQLTTGQSVYIDDKMNQSIDGLLVRVSAGNGPAGQPCTPAFVLNAP